MTILSLIFVIIFLTALFAMGLSLSTHDGQQSASALFFGFALLSLMLFSLYLREDSTEKGYTKGQQDALWGIQTQEPHFIYQDSICIDTIYTEIP